LVFGLLIWTVCGRAPPGGGGGGGGGSGAIDSFCVSLGRSSISMRQIESIHSATKTAR